MWGGGPGRTSQGAATGRCTQRISQHFATFRAISKGIQSNSRGRISRGTTGHQEEFLPASEVPAQDGSQCPSQSPGLPISQFLPEWVDCNCTGSHPLSGLCLPWSRSSTLYGRAGRFSVPARRGSNAAKRTAMVCGHNQKPQTRTLPPRRRSRWSYFGSCVNRCSTKGIYRRPGRWDLQVQLLWSAGRRMFTHGSY